MVEKKGSSPAHVVLQGHRKKSLQHTTGEKSISRAIRSSEVIGESERKHWGGDPNTADGALAAKSKTHKGEAY